MGAGRKKETLILSEKNPLSSMSSNCSVSARRLSKSNLGGVIFGCTHDTMSECLSKNLFGLPYGHSGYVKNISPGLPLFLFNYSDRKLHGIYEATTYGQLDINTSAWTNSGMVKTPYPAQVSIRIKAQCQPLNENRYKSIIEDNYYTSHHFYFELDHAQTKGLITLFQPFLPAANDVPSPIDLRKFPTLPAPVGIISSKVPIAPGIKWTDVVKHKQHNAASIKISNDQEPSITSVDMLKKEKTFPPLPDTKWKEVAQGRLGSRAGKSVNDLKPSTSSVNENKFVCLSGNDGYSIDTISSLTLPSVLKKLESTEPVSNWELADDDVQNSSSGGRPSLYGARQMGQEWESGNEEFKSEEQRVLHKADLQNLASSLGCYTDDSDVPCVPSGLGVHDYIGHVLDEPNVSVKKQEVSNAFDLHYSSYKNLGVAELVQVIKKLEEQAENLANRQVESNREVLQLKNIVRDTEEKNRLLKDRVEELESKMYHSMALGGSWA